jgi:hypothetical protein
VDKNILIIGPARSGKTILSRRISKKLGYSIVNLDDIICSFEEAFPQLEIRHDYNDIKVATRFAPFLIRYLKELSEGPIFYNGSKYVIEGVSIDFEKVIPMIDKEKYIIIGLTYNSITSKEFYLNVKKYDTEDDWTYYCSDEELKDNINYFIKSNKYFSEKFKDYKIKTYDVSKNRQLTYNKIVEEFTQNKIM